MNYGDCNCSSCANVANEQYANGTWGDSRTGDSARKSLASGHRNVAGKNIEYYKENSYNSSEGGVAADGRSQTLGTWNGGRNYRGGSQVDQGGRQCGPNYGSYGPYGRPRWGFPY